jgi:hypothetical protein
MERMIVTNPMIGIVRMQACVEKECTNEEILAFCNRENPAGTRLGWCEISNDEPWDPVDCADDSNRKHVIAIC